MSGPKPSAGGSLSSTPLSNLLVYALDRKLDGTLVIEDPSGGKSAILFERGAPAKARTSEAVHPLGSVLMDLRRVDEPICQRTLTLAARERSLHGQVLKQTGMITQEGLLEGLAEQVRRKVVWMFSLPAEAVYGYYDGVDFLQRWGGPETTPIEVLSVIWRGVRSQENPAHAREVLRRLGEAPIRIHPAAQLARFGLEGAEQAVVDVLRAKPQSITELIRTELLEEVVLCRLLYVLAITRHLDIGDSDRLPVGCEGEARPSWSRSQQSVPRARSGGPLRSAQVPPSPSQEDSKRTSLREKAEQIAAQNYYQILGVEPSAPTGVVHGAFLQLAKQWHPDRLDPELADLRDLAAKTFSRISEAAAVLTDPMRRSDYDQLLADGGGSIAEQEEVAAVLKAARAYQRAEILLKKGQLDQAAQEAQIAYENDQEQADYAGIYAWIQAQQREREGSANCRDLLEILDRAVEREPENLRIRYYRGQLLKRMGRTSQAMKDFLFISKRAPNHVDAQREIRLFQMRRGEGSARLGSDTKHPTAAPSSSRTSGEVASFFGRLFKR